MSSSADETWLDRALRGLSEHERERPSGEGSGRASGPAPEIPGYEIGECVGEGASAVVYRARDTALGRAVAVKVLRERLALSETARKRFEREAQAAARLAHPNVVAVHAVGEERGHPYLVMELVGGRPLSEALQDVPRDGRRLLSLLERAARGVAAAHEKGIVHRDLKPANILVTPEGEPKVGDFGLAHLADSGTALTRTGTTLGTPLYMAPEQVEGRADAISPRTDVYALGAILYEILAGRPPHTGETVIEIYGKITHADPVAPRSVDPRVSHDLETVILKALEKEPGRRYASARELADDLRRYLDGEPVTARPVPGVARLWRKARKHRAVLVPSVAVAALGAAAGLWAIWTGARKVEELERREQALVERARLHDEALLQQENVLRRRAALAAGLPAPPSGDVVFREDFENYNRNGWNEYGGTAQAIAIVDGGPERRKCLQLTAQGGEDLKVYVYRALPVGLDVCHVRFYVKFVEKEHDYVHQSARLVAYNPPTGWPQMRPPEQPSDGARRFDTILEPSTARGKYPAPGVWRFISDWCGVPPNREGKYFGTWFVSEEPVEAGRWTCVEMRLKCNSGPDSDDGEQALWVEGREVGRWGGFRWRTDGALKVNGIQLLNQISEKAAPDKGAREPARRVWFDDLVVARSYVGPLGP